MATKDCIQGLQNIIVKQNEKIEVLESRLAVMEKYVLQLENGLDDQEQYNRRLCLRIDGIESEENESAEKCFTKVNSVFQELNVNVPDNVIDRAHRIGRPKIANGKRVQTMIVRFTTWRHRTAIYRARKCSNKYKIRLDLTKKRLNTVKNSSKLLEGRNIGFVFADINCRVCAKIQNKFHYFDREEDLKEILSGLSLDNDSDNEEGSETEG
ncbi:MAG: hypothetical protein GY823_07315 [Flavobacteriaceae bacterium]|nr:hypothetical protein [Flavobacteriaceae bacterium]